MHRLARRHPATRYHVLEHLPIDDAHDLGSADAAALITRDSAMGALPSRGLVALVLAPWDVLRTAGSIGVPWVAALERVRATTAQYHLDRRHRAANVADAFAVRAAAASAVRGRWVVLVDDVVTTGATLCAAGEALLSAGAFAVSAITVARER